MEKIRLRLEIEMIVHPKEESSKLDVVSPAHRALNEHEVMEALESQGHLVERMETKVFTPSLEEEEDAPAQVTTCAHLRWVIDEEPYDASFVDDWTDLSEEERREAKEKIRKEVEANGVYGRIAEVCCPQCGEWTEVGSVFGIIGHDTENDGTVVYDAEAYAKEKGYVLTWAEEE